MKSLIVFFLLLFSSISLGQKLSARDSIETMADDDIFAVQLDSSSAYTWRKVFYSDLLAQFSTIYGRLGEANTFTGINTFEGQMRPRAIIPTTDDTYAIGMTVLRHNYIHAKTFYGEEFSIIDPDGVAGDSSDAAKWSYDGTNLTVDKPLALSKDLAFDSSFVLKNTALGTYTYTIANVGDSVLTLQDTCSVIQFSLPGNVTGLETLSFASGQGRGVGTIIRLVNALDAVNTIVLEDEATTGGNLFLAGNFTMGLYDSITLVYILKGGTFLWAELSRSNN